MDSKHGALGDVARVALVKFKLEDKSWVYMEVDEKLSASQAQGDDDLEGLAGFGDNIIQAASRPLNQSFSAIKSIGNSIIERVKEFNEPADEVEVKFGVKMSVDLGAVIAKGSGEANYEITLKWDNREKNKALKEKVDN